MSSSYLAPSTLQRLVDRAAYANSMGNETLGYFVGSMMNMPVVGDLTRLVTETINSRSANGYDLGRPLTTLEQAQRLQALSSLAFGSMLSLIPGSFGSSIAKGDLKFVAPAAPKPPSISSKLEKVGLTDEVTLKIPADQVGDGFRSISFSVRGGKLRRPLVGGGLASFKGQTVDFVITMNGSLIVGKGHSVLSNGKSVRFAGELKMNQNGEIVAITNRCGHYKPDSGVGLTDKAEQFLENEGLDFSKARVIEMGE